MAISAESFSNLWASTLIDCKAMICTALRVNASARLANSTSGISSVSQEKIVFTNLSAGSNWSTPKQFWRPPVQPALVYPEQSLTEYSRASIVGHASRLGGRVQMGAWSPLGAS